MRNYALVVTNLDQKYPDLKLVPKHWQDKSVSEWTEGRLVSILTPYRQNSGNKSSQIDCL